MSKHDDLSHPLARVGMMCQLMVIGNENKVTGCGTDYPKEELRVEAQLYRP